jgi:hypothetical protein
MNIVKIANYAFTFYFFNVVFKNMYPETYNNCLIKVSYCSVYGFTKIQMKVMQTRKFIVSKYNTFLLSYPSLKKYINNFCEYFVKTQDVEYISDGTVIETTSKKWLLQNYKKIEPSENSIYKMTIYTNGINKKVLSHVPFEETHYNCEKTSYKFILIEIQIYSEIKKIDLTTNDYNYMLVGNVINKDFVMYLLKTHYPKFVKIVKYYYSGKLDKYTIKILDQDVNEILLNQYNYLTLKKDGYKISSVKDVNN